VELRVRADATRTGGRGAPLPAARITEHTKDIITSSEDVSSIGQPLERNDTLSHMASSLLSSSPSQSLSPSRYKRKGMTSLDRTRSHLDHQGVGRRLDGSDALRDGAR